MVHRAQQRQLWLPRGTAETRVDRADGATREGTGLPSSLAEFAAFALILAAGGFALQKSAVALSQQTGLDEIVMGDLFTAIATSVPELVTTLATARRGALALAVGGIIGGNIFDVLFTALAYAAYAPGGIYYALSARQVYFIALAMLLTAVLLLGMLHREKHGVANIGFEGVLLLGVYGLGIAGLIIAH